MNYLVAVLRDRIQAEAAYSALEAAELPTQQISIVGRGYKSADELGLLAPIEQAQKQAKLMAIWLIPFGFAAGITFSLMTNLDTFAWAGEVGNHVIGGLLGALAGALGSLFAGGGAGLILGSGDALPYRDYLNAGRYLVVVKGTPLLAEKATGILRQFEPENLQGYVER